MFLQKGLNCYKHIKRFENVICLRHSNVVDLKFAPSYWFKKTHKNPASKVCCLNESEARNRPRHRKHVSISGCVIVFFYSYEEIKTNQWLRNWVCLA